LAYLAGLLPPGADVLDIGVGDGTFERLAAARGLNVHVLDPDPKAIERARTELGLGDRAKTGLGQALPWPDATFDAVVVSEVLEHLDDATLRATLAETKRVLRPSGRLIGTVPADERLDEQRVVCPDCGRRSMLGTSRRSLRRMESLLKESFSGATRRRWFVAWSLLNWKGQLQAIARKSLVVGIGAPAATWLSRKGI
jgi:SAM-dependent methyltransferase